MIDLTNWAAGHRGGIDGILAFLVLAMGSMCAVAVVVRLCSRLWRLMRHRSGEALKPLLEDESFVFELWGAIFCCMVAECLRPVHHPADHVHRTGRETGWIEGAVMLDVERFRPYAPSGQVRVRIRGRQGACARHEPARRIRRQGMALRPSGQTVEGVKYDRFHRRRHAGRNQQGPRM